MVRSRRAFTLLELLLGVTVTALVGVSAATVGSTLSTRYQKSEDYYQSLQTARVALGKLQSLFRSAQLVTQVSPTQIMAWREADGANGQVNPSELVVLTYSDGTICQSQIAYPAGIATDVKTVLDAPVSLASAVEQPASTTSTLASSPYWTSRVVASNVAAFSVSGDAAVPMSRMVTITVTSGQGASAVTLRSAACLRGGRTDRVATVGGHYALVSP